MSYLTAKDLLERKQAIQDRKNEKIVIQTDDGELLFRIPNRSDMTDTNKYAGDGSVADAFLIYATILEPNLRDPELQKAFLDQGQEPVEIVDAIFKPGEVTSIAEKLMREAGYFDEDMKTRKVVKN